MSVPVVEQLTPTPLGIVLAIYPASDPRGANVAVERAPDDSGGPDTGAIEEIARLPPGERVLIDMIGGGGPWHYRARHVRHAAEEGPYTNWVAARPTVIPPVLPNVRELVASLSGSDASADSHTGDTTETELRRITIPAGKLGSTGVFEVDFMARFSFTNGVKTLRVYLGSTAGTPIIAFTTPSAADVGNVKCHVIIKNIAADQQLGMAGLTTFSGRAHAGINDLLAEDSTQDMDVVITGQLAHASDEIAVDFHLARFVGDAD